MQYTCLQFPEVRLHPSQAHKMRGYFAQLFKQHSDLLHNHFETGESIYRYPMVQYKVINNKPTLIGLGEGAVLLVGLFGEVRELQIDDRIYPIQQKDLNLQMVHVRTVPNAIRYYFKTLWMALNQKNYAAYQQLNTPEQQTEFLTTQLRNNLVSFCKGIGYTLTEQIVVSNTHFEPHITHFKNQPMLAFAGSFSANIVLPKWVGLGKSVARGFGAVEK